MPPSFPWEDYVIHPPPPSSSPSSPSSSLLVLDDDVSFELSEFLERLAFAFPRVGIAGASALPPLSRLEELCHHREKGSICKIYLDVEKEKKKN